MRRLKEGIRKKGLETRDERVRGLKDGIRNNELEG